MNVQKNADFWNSEIKEYQIFPPGCSGIISWDIASENRMGNSSVREQFVIIASMYQQCRSCLKKYIQTKEYAQLLLSINFCE